MKMIEVDSKNLKEIGYDPEKNILAVRFKYHDRLYHYEKVPEKVWLALKEAYSKGEFFESFIKPIYKGKKQD